MSAPQQKVFTADQIAQYRKVFNMFDINKNGVIEANELEAVMRLLSSLKLSGGSLTFEQFLQSMPGYSTMQQAQQVTIATHPAPQSRHQQIQAMFRKFDKDNNGFISLEEAHSVLAQILGTTWEQTKNLVRQYDVNNDGRLSYNEFVAFYAKMEERRTQIDQAFRQFDRQGKGYITLDDAKVMLRQFGLSDPEIQSLVMFHDTNRDGKLQYSEFVQFWSARSGVMGQVAPAAAPQVAAQPQVAVSASPRHQQIQAMFRKFDKDNNGFISLEEAHSVLAQILGTTWEQTKNLVRQYDVNNDGRLSYNEFVAFYAKMEERRTQIDQAFKQFDRQGKGYITLEDAKVMLRQFGLSDPEIHSLVMFHDTNRDGKLQYSEFVQFWSARSGVMGQVAPVAAPQVTAQPQVAVSASPRHQQIQAMFRKFDKDNNGFISLEEAHSVLAQILGTTWEQTKNLVRQYDVNNDGRLSYNEFVAFYAKMEERRAQIDQAFRQFDRQGKGYITLDDAKLMLRQFGLSDPEIQSLVMFHDTNRDGKLQYSEFVQFWSARSGVMGQVAPVAAPQVTVQPQVAVSASPRHQQLQQKFRQFDRDGNGFISLDEAQVVLARDLGFSAERTRELVRQFDVNKDGRLSYNEFVAFYVKVEEKKMEIETAFRTFDRQGKGYVTLNDAKNIMRNFNFSDYEIEGLVRIHDKNQDGKLQLHEFVQFWTGASGQLAPMATPSAVLGAPHVAAPVQPQVAVGMSPRHQMIQAKFREFDRDGNGFITLDEAQIVLSRELGFSGEKTKHLVRQFDVNNDGRLSYNEFVAFYTKFEERKMAIQQAFNKFDVGNKGFVTVDDAKQIMRNFMFSDQEIERLVAMHDTNRDGRLQYSEFVRFWSA